MSAMPIPIEVERVASELKIPVDGLMKRSVRAFLRQETRATRMDIADLQDRYGVDSARDLRSRIEKGDIHSHPAWEDAIEWEQLEKHLAHIEEMVSEV
ncbi:MAG: hypothetical protein MAG431_02557 [Chloroflexi bacterium]|nr:hypothetical protein [Chloroflexota bacterium]